MPSSPMAIDEPRKRRQPDHTDDDDDADRKRPYQPSSSFAKGLGSDVPYDSVRRASRAGMRLSDADLEPPRRREGKRSNGADGDDDEDEEDKTVVEAKLRLDSYRKDAIYRHFLQSKRDLTRVQERLADREQKLQDADERIQAFNVFWDTLVEDVRLLFADDGALQDVDRTVFLDAIPFTTAPPSRKAFSATIETRTKAMQAVLSRISAHAAKADAPDVDSLRAQCHERASEAAFLKTSLASAQSTIDSLSDELHDAREALSRAELRADRAHSMAVRSAEMSGQERAAEESARAEREALLADVEKLKAERERQQNLPNGAGTDGKPVNGSTSNGPEEGSAAEAEAKAKADMAERLNEVQKISAQRLDEISKLRTRLNDAEVRASQLRRDRDYLPDSSVRASDLFKNVDREVVRMERQVEFVESKYARVRKENDELQRKMSRFKDEISKELSAELEKVKAKCIQVEADLQRVRTARDELSGELSERKARDKDRFASAEETRRLLAAKEVLLGVLVNENRAWRLKDAARRGDKSAFDALVAQGLSDGKSSELPVTVEDQLFARVKAAEALAAEQQRKLDALASGPAEADLASRLATVQKELEQVQALLQGAATSGQTADDVRKLLTEQSAKCIDLEGRILAETTRADAACDDLDKMSQAYEEAAKLAEDKVKHLTTLEDRVIRLNTEKSKADNKFFAAMRSKEALEAERKVAARNADRQNLVIQQLSEADKSRASHAASLEEELLSAERTRDDLQKRVLAVETQLTNATTESRTMREKVEKWERELLALQQQRRELDQQLFTLREEQVSLNKQVTKAQAERDAAVASREKALKRRAAEGGGGAAATTNVEAESLRSLLRCSSCHDNYRERIITKCMHTFCAQCIDARIQTRQRKCPHCGIAFAQSDVQMLYLQ